MRLKLITNPLLILLFTSIKFAQSSIEEKLRMDFVKSLSKKRGKENRISQVKDKPILANDTKQISDDSETNGKIIKVEVKNHLEYVILGRKFYFAPQEKKVAK